MDPRKIFREMSDVRTIGKSKVKFDHQKIKLRCGNCEILRTVSKWDKGLLIVCLKDKLDAFLYFLGFLPSHIPSVLSSWQRGRC